MSLWLTELLTPEALLRHLTLFLVVVAIAMPSLTLVRWLALAAGIAGVCLSLVSASDASGLFWWALLILVAVIRLALSSDWRAGGKLNAEEALFHRAVVPNLTTGQVRLLLKAGRWRQVVPGTVLTRAGQRVAELVFVVRGQVDIVVDGAKVADCGPGSLIGEIGMSTGEPATATSVCASPVRYLGFEADHLYRLLDRHDELQDAIELAVERSLRDKLARTNMAVAHPGPAPVRGRP
jgi:hypothetical protein